MVERCKQFFEHKKAICEKKFRDDLKSRRFFITPALEFIIEFIYNIYTTIFLHYP